MARPIKKGIDYFSHDVNMKEDIKIKLLRAKFGLTGYAVYNLLLEDIYKNGYFLQLNEDYVLIFSSENNIEVEQFESMVEFMISRQLFSEVVYNKYNVLTSKRIQSDFLHATIKRTETTKINPKYDVELVNSEKTIINSEKTLINDVSGTHSIEEKSIVEESKETGLIFLPVELEGIIDLTLWTEWVEYRKSINKPLSELSIKKQINFLLKQSNPVDCIDNAIMNGWQGLFEIKENGKAPLKAQPSNLNYDAMFGLTEDLK